MRPPVEDAWVRCVVAIEALTWIADPHHDGAIGIDVRRWLEYERLSDAEHGARQTDAQGDSPHSNKCERSLVTQAARSEPEIVREHRRMLAGSVDQDAQPRATDDHRSFDSVLFVSKAVYEHEGHFLPVLFTDVRGVQVQQGAEDKTGKEAGSTERNQAFTP